MNIFKTLLLLAAIVGLFLLVGWLIGGSGGALIALGFAIVSNVLAWWKSDEIVLRMHRAKAITQRNAPELFDMVAELAGRASLPMPKLYVIENEMPNAFATGRNPENSAVAVTTGILRALDRDELAGVVAHELAHVRNRDTLIMTVAATMAAAISMLSQYWIFFGGRANSRGPLGSVGTLLAVLFAPMAALVIRSTISRTREFSADRLGAQISGNPMALASALRKIADYAERAKQKGFRGRFHLGRNPATAHLFIVNPLTGGGWASLFSTHPPVEDRIRELMEIAEQLPPSPKVTVRETLIPSVPRSGEWS